MAYTTQAKIEGYLGKPIDASQTGQIASWIQAAQNFIEHYTCRTFEEEAGITRYFDGNGRREIIIDNFSNITELTILSVDGTAYIELTEGAGSDFVTFPYNESDGPKYKLQLTPVATIGAFISGKRRLKVTANWSYSETVPADIELVATMLVASVAEQGLKGGGLTNVTSESLGDYSIAFSDNVEASELLTRLGVKQILDQYIIYEL